MSGQESTWARQRGHAIAAHAAELARREAVESQQAAAMLREFVQAARDRGISPVALLARSYDGRHTYRTGLRGWYLTADDRLAAGDDDQFYILTVRGSVRARISGASVPPSRPRLVIGEGGRDGERISLRTLLDRRLA